MQATAGRDSRRWRAAALYWLDRLTLPVTRRAIARWTGPWSLIRIGAWPAVAVAMMPYLALRGAADDTGLPSVPLAHAADRVIGLGHIPSERLQDALFGGAGLSAFDWFWFGVYASWFFLPSTLSFYVLLRRWDLFRSLISMRLSLFYVAVACFFLLPTDPPWMATDVARVLEFQRHVSASADNNPSAALPSLHFGLPAALALWSASVGMRRWAWFFAIHATLVGFAVVYLGEHYVFDLAAGLVLAIAIVRWVGPTTDRLIASSWAHVPRLCSAAARSARANRGNTPS